VSYLRTAHERETYRRTFYEESDVYINKLGIRDQKILEATERRLTEDRAAEGFPARAHHRTYAGFKAIHRHLFQDLYEWAGREMRVIPSSTATGERNASGFVCWRIMQGSISNLVPATGSGGTRRRALASSNRITGRWRG
jgi:fido (protein-threonine AMPylation protein)